MGLSAGGQKQMETFVHCAPDGEPSPQETEMLWWVSPFFLGIFLLVPLFPTRANLFLGELAHPVQGHQASKEAGSKLCPMGSKLKLENGLKKEQV